MRTARRMLMLGAFMAMAFATMAQPPPPLFEEGCTVAFHGDSITHNGWYPYYLQMFYATRFPGRRVTMLNAGISATCVGDTRRLEEDVLARKPDQVYIMFGMNDVGRGNYKSATVGPKTAKARQKSLDTFVAGLTRTLDALKAAGVAPVLVTPSPYDQYSKTLKCENMAACNDGLGNCAKLLQRLASERGCPLVDLHTPMTSMLERNPELKLAYDRIHPNKTGHMLIAYYMLRAQQAPGLVAKVHLDYAGRRVVAAERCELHDVKFSDDGVSYEYQAESLPFPVSEEYLASAKLVPWDELNQELIQLGTLPPGSYRLLVEGREVGRFTAAQLAAGVNIATLDTPQQREARRLRDLVLKMAQAERPSRCAAQVDYSLLPAGMPSSDTMAVDRALDQFLDKVGEKHRSHFAYVVQVYRGHRAKRDELARELDALREELFRVPPKRSHKVEILKAPSESGETTL